MAASDQKAVDQAAETESTPGAKTKPVRKKRRKGKWVRRKGLTYYKDRAGKRVKGLRKIGKRTYYFDKKGVQRTGWRKVGKNYYFFRQKQG